MASSKLLSRHNQVKDSCSSEFRHGCSKAQACLTKILRTITSISPCEIPKLTCLDSQAGRLNLKSEGKDSGDESNRGLAIDLNLRLGPCLETEEESESLAEICGLSACSVVAAKVEKSSEGECDLKDTEDACQTDSPAIVVNRSGEESVVEDKGTEVSEITNLRAQSFEINDNGVKAEDREHENDDGVKTKSSREKDHRSEGYLGLLIKAAEVIDSEFEDDEPPPPQPAESEKPSQDYGLVGELAKTETAMRNRTSRNRHWHGDFDDMSPVVRSKRGRSQVLPSKFRDSVLEPWKPLARPQRSTVVATKRRSR